MIANCSRSRFNFTVKVGGVQADRDLGRLAHDLGQSEAQLRAIFEQGAVGMALVGLDGRPMRCNSAFEHFIGYRESELRGMTFADFTHPDDLDADVRLFHSLLAGDTNHYQLEKRYIRKDGATVWGRLTVSLVDGAKDDPGCVVGLVEDITARKQGERDHEQLQAQLHHSQKMEAVGSLAGGIAHDFNNVLTVIASNCDLLLFDSCGAEMVTELVTEIRQAAERAVGLTRQLLAFSRKAVVQPVVLDPGELVRQMSSLLRRLIGEDISLSIIVQPAVARVRADFGQLEQVLLNLAVNARDAMPTTGKLAIDVQNVDLDQAYAMGRPDVNPGPYVRLTVTDTGCGMDAEIMARIFEPFFTTKGPEKGTGLGLSVAFGIVKQSGGHITVESEPGKGATFRIYLPQVDDAFAAVQSVAAGRLPLPRGTETVLLVEDEPTLRKLVRTVLQLQGYSVLDAQDGVEALRIAAGHAGPIHLLVTDVVLPRITGRQIAESVRAGHRETKVLFVSGYTDDALIRYGVLHAEISFLQKPFTPSTLAQKVRDVLDRAGA